MPFDRLFVGGAGRCCEVFRGIIRCRGAVTGKSTEGDTCYVTTSISSCLAERAPKRRVQLWQICMLVDDYV